MVKKKKHSPLDNLKSKVLESFRSLRTNIQYSSLDESLKIVTFTSALAAEGKSTIVTNLARTMAQNNKKVLVLDCDFRKPTIHKKFNVPNSRGLTDILVGQYTFDECINTFEDENLFVLTCGTIPPNPSELLNSNVFKKLVNDLKCMFDIILVDSPPVLAVTDAQILSTTSDGTYLISVYGKTDKKLLLKSKEMLEQVGGSVKGVIINKVPDKADDYYYNKYYHSY